MRLIEKCIYYKDVSMLEQIHPYATKSKDGRYYNVTTTFRDLARRKNFEKFWEQGAHVRLDTLNQCEKVLSEKNPRFLNRT